MPNVIRPCNRLHVTAFRKEEDRMTKRHEHIRENNLLNERPINRGLPYTLEEIELIARTAPIKVNRKVLADTLGRSENAIAFIWWLLGCSIKYLKQTYGTSPHIDKVIKVKKSVGYAVSNTPVQPRENTEEVS